MITKKDRKKSVCIIRSNPVKPDSRVEKEAYSLTKAGYSVHILAWDRGSDILESDDYIVVANEQIAITRLGHPATYGEGFKNIKSYLAFQLHMRKWLKTKNFDVIHACDFDTAFFSRGIARKYKSKFVFDIFDFIYGRPRNLFQNCVKKAQLRIINRADATIICTEDRCKQIEGSYPRQLIVLHNTPAISQLNEKSFKIDCTERIKIVYVGILQDSRLLKEIADVVAESKELELHIGGFGKYESYFNEISQSCDNIFFYGRLSYDETLSLEKACDIMIAIYDPEIENHQYAAPNKFYESLLLGKPILMAAGTGMSSVVEENQIGILIKYSKEGFKEGIKQLVELRDQWEKMEKEMQRLYYEQYSWSEMESRLVRLYEKLTL